MGGERDDFPWRRTRDPWRVLVSEVMLQQTQVRRVVGPYEAFVARFPTPGALAEAPVGAAVSAWQGLGYNRRAVSLHAAATAIVHRHGGQVPAQLPALLDLPGVGPYTARAVLAFAFGADAAPVDTNIARVLKRAFAGAPLSAAPLQRLADELVPSGRAREWGLELMDLGATVCTPRRPRCDACPLRATCRWRAAGGPGSKAEDPAATGAAAARRQPRFEGSDRYHRGQLVDALRRGPVSGLGLPEAALLAQDEARARVLADALVRDGIAEWHHGKLRLPAGQV